ncbi:DUF4910 domain-containing protein [Lentisphaera profundi]|uniref:DUF4910 domain-containing protein n=1 Tax=Lentisphaera profundi TaxID=1658616 RepID=A0ABY7VY46_9BACT|nr:DUF4910 domain-containing protein [Lentisphaera profundi]WDE98198.1 DUF4910 domain-containing protein [Lentisphaera profundi]
MIKDLEQLFDDLWPICRSITGDGLRQSFKLLQEVAPYRLTEVPSGTKVFDWEVPREWNIHQAYILDPEGKRICDFKVNNLHVVNYSCPITCEMSLEQLIPHLHYLENQPEIIPYITSYYQDNWGFCLSHNQFKSLREGLYQVVIASSLEKGSLTYGDLILKGASEQEILLTSYLCHPSMAINELSGPLVLSFLYRELNKIKNRKFTYRFVLAPETIGHIAYIDQHHQILKKNVVAGYVITCVGHDGKFVYKKSRLGDKTVDQITEHYLKFSAKTFEARPFTTGGSDERQYCSPGIDLPVGSLMRTPYKEYAEYHTSADNKAIISFDALQETVEAYQDLVKCIELNQTYIRTNPHCEVQLGKRGLYDNIGAWTKRNDFRSNLLNFLAFCDGNLSLLEISELSQTFILDYTAVIEACLEHDLIKLT